MGGRVPRVPDLDMSDCAAALGLHKLEVTANHFVFANRRDYTGVRTLHNTGLGFTTL